MSVSEKVKCIDGRNKKLSISRQCELLQLPRSSYYRPRYYQVEDEENLELMRLIDEEFLRHPFYGSRKMKVYLNRRGLRFAQKIIFLKKIKKVLFF
jgi:putative transposase